MKCSALFSVVLALALPSSGSAFSSFTGTQLSNVQNRGSTSITMEYIPSGMSKEQWKKLKDAEKKKTTGKNLGKVGITSFQSRSFAEWQKSGGKNLFPVDPKKAKSAADIPYMQRKGGKPDDSDLKGNKGGFSFFGKKKEPEPEAPPEPEKKNWWTL